MLSNLSVSNRQYSDFEPETERSGGFGGWLPKKKVFEHLELKVGSWPDELPDIDLSEIERIYLRTDYYQLLPFQSNQTYTRKVMSKFLHNETECRPISEPVNEPNTTRKSDSPTRTSTRTSTRRLNRTLNSGKNQEGESSISESSLIVSESRRTGEATCSGQQNSHPELQSDREDPDEEGIFSRLRKKLVGSVHTTSDKPTNNAGNNLNTKPKNANNKANGPKDCPLETNLDQATDSSQSAGQKGRILASRESSLIKQRLLKKQVWLNEQAMLKDQNQLNDMNANYLDDRNELNTLVGYSDDECDLNQEKGHRSEGPLNSAAKRRTSNRTRTPSKLFTASGIASFTSRRPARRKAKENLCTDKEVRFAADTHLNFSDLDEPEVEHNKNLRTSFHELEPLKPPTKQIYLFVAFVFLSVFAFKFINSP